MFEVVTLLIVSFQRDGFDGRRRAFRFRFSERRRDVTRRRHRRSLHAASSSRVGQKHRKHRHETEKRNKLKVSILGKFLKILNRFCLLSWMNLH